MKNNNASVKSLFSLQNHINYQEGSVVSREIFRNNSGTMTLFAFDAGQELSEHKTPFDALVNIIDGEAEITVDNIINIVRQGEIIHMPANKIHALKAHSRFKMVLTMFKN